MEPICPSCKNTLKKIPQRKTKCQHCGIYIFLGRWPGTEENILVTEEDKVKIQQAWSQYHYEKEYAQKMESLYQYGLNTEEVNGIKEELRIKHGYEPVYRDILWTILNKLLSFKKEYRDLQWIYDQMALLVNQEGKSSFQLQTYSNQCNLYNLLELEVYTTVTVQCTHTDCEACSELHDKKFKITDIVNNLPIPSKQCTNFIYSDEPYCTCYFMPD